MIVPIPIPGPYDGKAPDYQLPNHAGEIEFRQHTMRVEREDMLPPLFWDVFNEDSNVRGWPAHPDRTTQTNQIIIGQVLWIYVLDFGDPAFLFNLAHPFVDRMGDLFRASRLRVKCDDTFHKEYPPLWNFSFCLQ